jgi:hypothetical protein
LADPALARRYGEEGRAEVSREWSWERAAARLETHLAGAASRRRQPAVGTPLQPPVDAR